MSDKAFIDASQLGGVSCPKKNCSQDSLPVHHLLEEFVHELGDPFRGTTHRLRGHLAEQVGRKFYFCGFVDLLHQSPLVYVQWDNFRKIRQSAGAPLERQRCSNAQS